MRRSSARASGTTCTSTYVRNNGYIVCDGPRSTYTPFPLIDETSTPIIAPFFADVDTRGAGSSLVTYGGGTDSAGQKYFCVDWINVGYYSYASTVMVRISFAANAIGQAALPSFASLYRLGDPKPLLVQYRKLLRAFADYTLVSVRCGAEPAVLHYPKLRPVQQQIWDILKLPPLPAQTPCSG